MVLSNRCVISTRSLPANRRTRVSSPSSVPGACRVTRAVHTSGPESVSCTLADPPTSADAGSRPGTYRYSSMISPAGTSSRTSARSRNEVMPPLLGSSTTRTSPLSSVGSCPGEPARAPERPPGSPPALTPYRSPLHGGMAAVRNARLPSASRWDDTSAPSASRSLVMRADSSAGSTTTSERSHCVELRTSMATGGVPGSASGAPASARRRSRSD